MIGIADPVTFLNFFLQFKKYLNNILVIKRGKKFKKCFFLFMALKSYEAFFDHFLPEPCGRKSELFAKKKIFDQICFYII